MELIIWFLDVCIVLFLGLLGIVLVLAVFNWIFEFLESIVK